MKLSAADTVRMLMRINNTSYKTIAEKTGYNLRTGAAKVVARDSHMQVRTFAKFLSVFDANIVVRYPYPDGTTHEIELDIPAKEKDDEIRMQE